MGMNVFEKLMLGRQLLFSEGTIELFGNKTVLFDSDVFSRYLYDIKDSTGYTTGIYRSLKEGIKDSVGVVVMKRTNFNFQKGTELFIKNMKEKIPGGELIEKDSDPNHLKKIFVKKLIQLKKNPNLSFKFIRSS